MSRHSPPPRTLTWDLFCPTLASDDLRCMTLLASQLASEPTHRVRLFINDPERLSPLSARIEGLLWWQPLANYDLVRLRLADAVVPADHVVCLAGTELPARYRERMAYGSGSRCKLFRIWPLGHHATTSAIDSAPGPSCALLFDVFQDDKPQSMGLIRDSRNLEQMRTRWKAHGSLTQTTLENLGLPADATRDTVIVCNWDAAIGDPMAFRQTLDKISTRPILLLEPVSPANQGLHTADRTADTGFLRRLKLPDLSWSQIDEIIWSADLVFCGRRDIAQRAMESGTPMMWLPPAPAEATPGDELIDWYFEEWDPGSQRRLVAAGHSLRTNTGVAEALTWYFTQRDDLEQIARQVATRMAGAPNLADTLPSLSPAMIEQARRRKQQQDLAHPPTWPMSLPGHPESA